MDKVSNYIMEDLRIYGFNLGAIIMSLIEDINPVLSTIALVCSIAYTLISIKHKMKNEKDN